MLIYMHPGDIDSVKKRIEKGYIYIYQNTHVDAKKFN
jgi:hypothetical protein